MRQDVRVQAAAYAKKERRKRFWRRIVGILACIVVFCTTYALILPAITLEGYTCGLEEHVHTESCYQRSADCTDPTALTCTLEESGDHTHSTLCFGTWELICTDTEHTHTADCKPAALTETQQAEVDAVIARIDALPTADQIDQTLEAYADDEDGELAYLTQLYTEVQAAYQAYQALGTDLQPYVTNALKLMDLEWIWGAAAYAQGGNQILEYPDGGNWVYVDNVKPQKVTTGTEPFDTTDGPGYDTSDENSILRTFDRADYLISFEAQLNQSNLDADGKTDVAGFQWAYLYFEFLVPGTAEQVQIDVDAMPWLKYDTSAYTLEEVELDGSTYQTIRGRMKITASDNSVIGASAHEISFSFRALKLKNGDTVQPVVNLWLMNNVAMTGSETAGKQGYQSYRKSTGAVSDSWENALIPAESVYANVDETWCQATSCLLTELTISAKANYNVAVVAGSDDQNRSGTFDFTQTQNTSAINYNLGTREGRLIGYGLRLEIMSLNGKDLRGIELPGDKEELTITFTVATSKTIEKGEEIINVEGYDPLFWSGGGNQTDNKSGKYETDNEDGRLVADSTTGDFRSFIRTIPYNQVGNNIVDTSVNACIDGGTWKFVQNADGTLQVTVTGTTLANTYAAFDVKVKTENNGMNSVLPFPCVSTIYTPASSTNYYTYNQADDYNYWDVKQAVFSTGELWLIQPYTDADGKYIVDEDMTECQADILVEASDLKVNSGENTLGTDTNEADNSVSKGYYLKTPGQIVAQLNYASASSGPNSGGALTEGCEETDADWAVAGQDIALKYVLQHTQGDGEYQGVAYDMLMKFDADFMELRQGLGASNDEFGCARGLYLASYDINYLYATRENGQNWETVEQMKQATYDDLVFYDSYGDVPEGAAIVAVLAEFRGVTSVKDMTVYLYGTIKETCPTDKVYMITRTTYAWNKANVEVAAKEYFAGLDAANYDDTLKALLPDGYNSESELTDELYTYYVCQSGQFPSQADGSKPKLFASGNTSRQSIDGNYPAPFWRQDYYITNSGGKVGTFAHNTGGLQTAAAATWGENGYSQGSGLKYYQDSCLVMAYRPTIIKTTPQQSNDGNAKTVYNLDLGEQTVDFVLQPDLEKCTVTGAEGDAVYQDITLVITDILPEGLSYIEGTAVLGGTYTADPACQSPGTVTGGTKLTNVVTGTVAQDDTDFAEEDRGKTTVTFTVTVNVNMNDPVIDPIYFSCAIDPSLGNNKQLNNKAAVTLDGMKKIPYSYTSRNLANYNVTTSSLGNLALSKIADQRVVEAYETMGFTMVVSNASSEKKSNAIIVDTLPVNGEGGTQYTGSLIITELTAKTNKDAAALNGFAFYYTANAGYIDKTSAELQSENFADTSVWTKLTFAQVSAGDSAAHALTGFPGEDAQKNDPVALIVAVGDLPANETLRMHIRMKVDGWQPLDKLVNNISLGNLVSHDWSQVINRTLSGLTWMDANGNGRQDTGETYLAGVRVQLLKLKSGADRANESDYEVVKETTTGADGQYQFTNLASGIYAVRFTDPESVIIKPLLASPANYTGVADDADSDGVPTYSGSGPELLQTLILDIEMPGAVELQTGLYESPDHDSGFYQRGFELPSTGGAGTQMYTWGGLLLMLCAAALLYWQKRRREKQSTP